MPRLLRKTKRSNWYLSEVSSWLPHGDVPADALGDLRTSGNRLSVWRVEDDERDVDSVVAALAATRDVLDNFDYALFDERILDELGIRSEPTVGDSPDDEVNRRHLDLVELSGQKLVTLAYNIFRFGKTRRVLQKTVRGLIANAVCDKRIPEERLRPGIRSKLP